MMKRCSVKTFHSPEELYEAVGKQVRTMPQIQDRWSIDRWLQSIS